MFFKLGIHLAIFFISLFSICSIRYFVSDEGKTDCMIEYVNSFLSLGNEGVLFKLSSGTYHIENKNSQYIDFFDSAEVIGYSKGCLMNTGNYFHDGFNTSYCVVSYGYESLKK